MAHKTIGQNRNRQGGKMNYTAYGNTKSVPKRLARKHLRSEVFLANKKMKTLQRKAERANRKSLVEGE
jgi:hypothetical protein